LLSIVSSLLDLHIFEIVHKIIYDEFDIEHVTIQFEYGGDEKMGCDG